MSCHKLFSHKSYILSTTFVIIKFGNYPIDYDYWLFNRKEENSTMKFTRKLTFQLGSIIAGILIVMMVISSIATYKTAYDKLYEAAGIEAYGCANITTGLIKPEDVNQALSGNQEAKDRISEQLNWTTAHKDIFESQYILDLEGNILALDQNLTDKGFHTGDSFHIDKSAMSTLLSMKHSTYTEPYTYGGLKRLSGYAPIYKDNDPTQEIIAVSVIDFDANIVSTRTWGVVSKGILVSIIPMLLAAIVTFFLIRRKTKPISQLISQAKEIASGNLSVANNQIKSNDEIGDLAQTLNQVSDNLEQMIATMHTTSHQLSENAQETASSLTEMNNAVQIVAHNIEDVSIAVTDGMHHTENASTVLISLAEESIEMKQRADQTVEKSNQTMAVAKQGEQRAIEISRDMERIRGGSQEVSQTISDLVESASQIQTITTSISGIASQTNLLALNASIEAARAGEHGKGFAVVAEEVRKLAEQSDGEASQVEKLVQDIMKKIQHVLESVEDNTKQIEQGAETVSQTVTALSEIAVSVAETVKETTVISNLMAKETDQAQHVAEMIQELATSIRGIENTMNSISAAAEETTAGIDEVSTRSGTTNEMACQLENHVMQFQLKE
ncbi:hypothetical protein RST01_03160 [Rummeliibacillus stabekisii]|nr:hypothetical protein RST01_03160 [Rummeliibacillus stabekisii]